MNDNRAEPKLKSLQKAIEVLNCFTEKQPLGVTEISEMLDLSKSTVHNFVSTLKCMKYLEQDQNTGKYQLGIGILRLSQALGDRFSLQNVARHYMQELADEVNAAVYLTVLMGEELYTMNVVFPSLSSTYFVGNIRAAGRNLHSSSCGKALLAYLPLDIQEKYIAGPLETCTEYTITDPVMLRKELENVINLGYAVDNMETEIGIRCVGVPVFSRSGNVIAALSVSGPAQQYTDSRIHELSNMLKRCARNISAES